ncbi:MAG: hypothetical protein FJX75_19430 [Armatimonadetes bacterium]|nr:hypothetical protein [Armatimonadota bacterium]
MGILGSLFRRPSPNLGLNTPDHIYLESADVHVARGEEALHSGDLDKALIEFKYAVIADNEVGRQNPKALSHLKGPVLGPLNIKRTTKGQSLMARALEAQQRGDHSRAVKLATEAMGLCPMAEIPCYGLRGKSYVALSRFQEAVADLTIAIAYAPNVAEFYAARATAHEALADSESARRDREKTCTLLR